MYRNNDQHNRADAHAVPPWFRSTRTRVASIGEPSSWVRQVPTASKVFRERVPRSKIWWHVWWWQLGFVDGASIICLIARLRFPVVSSRFSLICGTFGGGSGGLTPRNVCRNPLSPDHGRGAAPPRRHRQECSLAAQARRHVELPVDIVTRRNCGAIQVRIP